MRTRREFGGMALMGFASPDGFHLGAAFAQHAAVQGAAPPDTVWLNANENSEGPPDPARQAIAGAIADCGRYNHRFFPAFHEALARSAGVETDQVIPGAGSSEVLHCAIDAFTTASRPLITAWPTWEMTRDLAEASGKQVVKVPLTRQWSADVERMAEEARKAAGGVIHLGNPNNPTSSITPRQALRWLAENLPPDTVLLIDEAYIHFADSPDLESGIRYVREGRSVVVTRTFSKLYGMAGVRVGFGCAPAVLIQRMTPFRNNVTSILGARAAMAALELGDNLVTGRRNRRNQVRAQVCSWLDARGFRYVPPQANFVLVDIGRDVRDVIPRMLAEGVAVGRHFDSVDRRMRVAMGTEREMEKFQAAFQKVVG